MATDNYVPMEFTQGENFVTQVVWTDNFDEPLPVAHPCRMAIKSGTGQTILELETNPSIPEGTVPSIAISPETGLIQLYLDDEVTSGVMPGEYMYDLFATVDDGSSYPGPQKIRLCYGPVAVFKRITHL